MVDRSPLRFQTRKISTGGITFKHILLCFFLFSIPQLITFQVFFPKAIQNVIVYSRLIVAPLYIFFVLYKHVNFFYVGIFILYSLIINPYNPPTDINDYFIVFFSFFSSIAFFKLGYYISNKKFDDNIFAYLAYGTTVVNIITIILYFLLAAGVLDITTFFEKTGKDTLEGLFRFSVGNPIEIPFTITCFLYSAILLTKNKKQFLLAASANLLTAILGQSRIVVIIALLIFLTQFLKSTWKSKTVVLLVIIVALPFLVDEFTVILDSYFNRVQGDDSGSKEIRELYLNIFLENISPRIIIFGDGLTSSKLLLQEIVGKYVSIESSLLQTIYEKGIIGLILFISALYIRQKKAVRLRLSNFNIIEILIYIQLLFFINTFTLMFAMFFLFGINVSTFKNDNQINLGFSRKKNENNPK